MGGCKGTTCGLYDVHALEETFLKSPFGLAQALEHVEWGVCRVWSARAKGGN